MMAQCWVKIGRGASAEAPARPSGSDPAVTFTIATSDSVSLIMHAVVFFSAPIQKKSSSLATRD